jgi:putative endonuclease
VGDGRHYEHLAAKHLQAAGLSILEHNFNCKAGELDIVCRDGETVVFVEVRSRGPSQYATALESVDHSKQRKLIRAAQVYLQRKGWHDRFPCRFDVIAFDTDASAEQHHVQWIQDAFQT